MNSKFIFVEGREFFRENINPFLSFKFQSMENYKKLENIADGPPGSLPNVGSHLGYNRHFMDAAGKVKKGAGGRNAGGPKKKLVSQSVRASLPFPVDRIGCYLKKGRYAQRVGTGAPGYMNVVLEYLATEVLELAGIAARDSEACVLCVWQ